MKKISFICVLLLFFVSACSTVQYTKRSSLILVPESQEIALGITSFQEINQKEKISTDASQKALIEKVGRKIAAVADRPDYKWEFVLFDAPDKVNAFALPGGKVAFYTGIMPLCADENGVAVVMAHEIAHAIARHGAERMTHQLAAGFAGDVLSSAITKQTPNAQKAILTGYGLASQYGAILPFSRKQEYEADHIGLILMAKAGYKPSHAVDFWSRMNTLNKKSKIPEFLSTHPTDEKRIKQIQERIPEARGYLQQ